MVINCSVAGWDLHKVLVDNGSQADIIFLHAFASLARSGSAGVFDVTVDGHGTVGLRVS
jgi:sRNA-binding regulator protein Hfq